MSENEETATALDRIRGWREEYRLGLAPSPLEDVTQLSAQLDLTHAHPSGIAQLFAKGHVTLDSLFRDNGMLRAAGRRVERVLDDRDAKSRVSGVGELSLVVGVAIWKATRCRCSCIRSKCARKAATSRTAPSSRSPDECV